MHAKLYKNKFIQVLLYEIVRMQFYFVFPHRSQANLANSFAVSFLARNAHSFQALKIHVIKCFVRPRLSMLSWEMQELLQKIPLNEDFKMGKFSQLFRFLHHQGIIIPKKINSMKEIPKDFDFVINCTGNGAKELVGDPSSLPIRGQVHRVHLFILVNYFHWLHVLFINIRDFRCAPSKLIDPYVSFFAFHSLTLDHHEFPG